MKLIYLIIVFLSCFFPSWGQDSIRVIYTSKFHLEHDYRDYDEELERCVIFAHNRFIFGLSDGHYYFVDSVSNRIRIEGKVLNSRNVEKWNYYDSLGRKRIEDNFFNDIDSTILTNYFDERGILFRTKEGSNKFLRTVHYHKSVMTDYYYKDHIENSDVAMSFDSIGRLTHRSSSKNGLKHGEFYWVYDDGSCYAQQFFEHGKKVGNWKSNLKGNQGEWCTEIFENDKLVSISFRNGQTYKIESGSLEIINRYPSGKIRLKGAVVNGNKSGVWKYYNESGEVIGEFFHDESGNVTSSRFLGFDFPSI